MIWPFKKKPKPVQDIRLWNENWQVGDTAECVVGFNQWNQNVEPWKRPAKGTQFTVVGFSDEYVEKYNTRAYLLHFSETSEKYSCTAFRKVIPVKKAEETEIGAKILNAKPAPDIKRAKPAKVNP